MQQPEGSWPYRSEAKADVYARGYAVSGKKPVVVPEDAEMVRLIFRRYLALGSIGALSQELDRDGIRSRRQVLSNGRIRGGQGFSTGALFYLLKNRFYVGDIVYREVAGSSPVARATSLSMT